MKDILKINKLQFSSPEMFEAAIQCLDEKTRDTVLLYPSSYSSSVMVTFRQKFLKFREIIVKYNFRCRDENLNRELDEYKLKTALLGLGT